MAITKNTFGGHVVMTLVALITLVFMPLASSSLANANEAPCPHMAAMAEMSPDHHALTMATMPTGQADDMDCCGNGEKATIAPSSMSDCTFACKGNCFHVVTAILPATGDTPSPVPFESLSERPPQRPTSFASGFTTPPPRL